MEKSRKITLLIIFFILQLTFIFLGVIKNEFILYKGDTLKILTKPLDPYDAFRGNYLVLNYENSIKVSDGTTDNAYNKGDIVYIVYKEDDTGYSKIDYITKEKPKGEKYIKARVNYKYSSEIFLKLPFDRYYIDSSYAKEAEKLARDRNEEVYFTVKIYKGDAVISNLYVNKVKIIDYIKDNK